MIDQKQLFLDSEGDSWFTRNLEKLQLWNPATDPIVQLIGLTDLRPESILETGSSFGYRLHHLRQITGARVVGLEPSRQAIDHGRQTFPEVEFHQGTADKLPVADASCDLLISGFCLYLADRKDLYKICAEYERSLRDGGFLIIYDFYSKKPYKKPYKHFDGYYSYKCDYGKLFEANPGWQLLSFSVHDHGLSRTPVDPDDTIGLYLFKKVSSLAYETL
ncbi:MAG: hypothetical protein RL095_381 [Verrucomicrobiota bacterium]|jgi:SAM-dependent methyltransferase